VKAFPALKAFEKDKNFFEFRDRMRGYLGLPRQRVATRKTSNNILSYYSYYDKI
jgi:hypothetical protein